MNEKEIEITVKNIKKLFCLFCGEKMDATLYKKSEKKDDYWMCQDCTMIEHTIIIERKHLLEMSKDKNKMFNNQDLYNTLCR